MSCNGMMSFFPTNFMLQSPHDDQDDDHRQASNISLNPILPPSCCTPQEFHNVNSYNMGKRPSSMSFSGIDQEINGDQDDLSDEDGSQAGEKKRRLNMEQVKTLEKNFELGNKLEPERKIQLARALGLQPRQIAIWFQNRRARWKTKQLEKDYDLLKRQFDSIKEDNDALQSQNHKLHAEIMALKNVREPTESINLNKETEGSCSNRSENSSDHHQNTIQLDISRPPANTDHQSNDLSTNDNNISLFPTSLSSMPVMSTRHNNGSASLSLTHQLFQNPSRSEQHFQAHKVLDHHHQNVKEESFTNMFSGIDDQPGFWPWLEQQHQFN